MSREIDQEKIASGTLDEEEVRYLQDRNLLPENYSGKTVDDKLKEGTPLEQIPNTGDASMEEPEADPKEAARRSRAASDKGFEEETEEADEETEEDEDYDEGWTNDQRRAELSRRGLDIEGNKQEMIDRLLADDAAKA